jgi:hypothetical protein
MKLALKLASVMLMFLSLTACQTTGSAGTNVLYVPCESLEPIRWSKTDTRRTQEQVTEFNSVYKALCLKGK